MQYWTVKPENDKMFSSKYHHHFPLCIALWESGVHLFHTGTCTFSDIMHKLCVHKHEPLCSLW